MLHVGRVHEVVCA